MMGDDVQLRFGRWQEALADVERVDAVITDPPYSERTAKGQRSNPDVISDQSRITYGFLTREDVSELCTYWAPRTARWFVMFGDHVTVRWALDDLDKLGWYTFPPVVWAKANGAPRFMCDGPSGSQVEHVAIARPRRVLSRAEKRFRPGFYTCDQARGSQHGMIIGSKPERLMRAVVRDYSEPGDLIAEPFAGAGSTLLAAAMEGRRAIGAECDEKHFQIAQKRLARGYTPPLFAE